MISVTIQETPQTEVVAQLMLVQKPLPPADSLVLLFVNIPSNTAAVQATLPTNVVIFTRQVCRGSYCIACDGSINCVKRVWVGVNQGAGGKYAFNVSSVPADAIVYFVQTSKTIMCTPVINLPAEYQTGLTAVVTSISTITTIPLTCPTNAVIGNSLPVTGTISALNRRRRLLEAGRRSLSQSDALSYALVVETELLNLTKAVVASSNLTIQGYTSVTPPERQIVIANTSSTTNSSLPLTCPVNSTSPPGSISLSQCVCLPGYKGDAGSGGPCTPCDPNVFCSGGLIGMCHGNSTAPPMSNSSDACVCNPGFYGTASKGCVQCPANSFCTGGQVSTPCVANALSPIQSTSSDACYCAPGFNGTANQPCKPCGPGFWCWTGIANQCPTNWTSNATARRVTDCFCADGYQAVATKDASGNSITVCTLCAENTYCKVCTCPNRIYNAPHSVSQHAPATTIAFLLPPVARAPCKNRRGRHMRARPILKRHNQLPRLSR